ncbi:hypothetical protein PMIT1323_01857 [Prochlorococcus marinus str. MIT 1323]|nr:hypothetical protein PMIT1323_01857 [Prochlorococcus marinus str. MIT 1323]
MPILMIDIIGRIPPINNVSIIVVSTPHSQYYLAEFDGFAYVPIVLFLQG